MKEVFISYSSLDLTQANVLSSILEENGLSCWIAPRDIPGGSNYTREIPAAIRSCKVFVLVLSGNAQNSHWVLKELDTAVNSGKIILPFMLEDCALNDEFNFLLTGAQRYAAYQKKAEAMEHLVGRIRGILDLPPVSGHEPEEHTALREEAFVSKPDDIRSGEEKCPACGGTQWQVLKKRIKCEGMEEFLIKLWIPVLTVAAGLLGLLISAFTDLNMSLAAPLFMGCCGVLGAVLGVYVSREMTQRKRLRRGFLYSCCRCSRCKKVFNLKQLLDH